MSMSDESLLDSQLRECVSDAVPPAVEGRLRARLADFRSRLGASEMVAATPARRASLTAWWRLGLTCAAAGLLVAVLGLSLRPRVSFAEVATAVLMQPWVHMRITLDGQDQCEVWFSRARNVMATRRPDTIEYEDYRLQVVDSYDPKDKVVYHAPIVWKSRAQQNQAGLEALAALLQSERVSEKPLAQLGLLVPQRATVRVLDQQVEKVTEAGHSWLDYHLTVTEPGSGTTLRMHFRADATSKLPSLCSANGQHDGKPVAFEMRFDYPAAGPADLYALGVPRTAQRVDRVPAGDAKRIVETLKAGRERMDNYRAVFVKHMEGIDYAWWTEMPQVFYRKGTKYRADSVSGWTGSLGAIKRPAQGEDLGKWWRERTKFFRYYPQTVVRDMTTFSSVEKAVTGPDGTQHEEIVSVQSWESGNNSGVDYPPEWSMRPEFACRPPMGLGRTDMEPVVDMHPTDGPPGCVRLSVRHTSTKGRVNEKGVGIPDGYRYWLDPERDFIVMRWDCAMRDATGQEKVTESDITEETARSPQGVWYATRIRRKFPDSDGKAKQFDQVYHLYVDFDADLPDTLFEPPAPGRVR